jgi:hypothetical protein
MKRGTVPCARPAAAEAAGVLDLCTLVDAGASAAQQQWTKNCIT